jgi:hypothetical protein
MRLPHFVFLAVVVVAVILLWENRHKITGLVSK